MHRVLRSNFVKLGKGIFLENCYEVHYVILNPQHLPKYNFKSSYTSKRVSVKSDKCSPSGISHEWELFCTWKSYFVHNKSYFHHNILLVSCLRDPCSLSDTFFSEGCVSAYFAQICLLISTVTSLLAQSGGVEVLKSWVEFILDECNFDESPYEYIVQLAIYRCDCIYRSFTCSDKRLVSWCPFDFFIF